MSRDRRYPGTLIPKVRAGKPFKYTWKGSVHGQFRTATIYTGQRREAEAAARRIYAEFAKGGARPKAPPRTEGSELRVSELLDRYEATMVPGLAPGTQRTYAGSLARFREYFVTTRRDPKAAALVTDDVDQFITWRRTVRRAGGPKRRPETKVPTLSRDVSNRTLQKDVTVLTARKAAIPQVDARAAVLLSDDEYSRLMTEATAGSAALGVYALLLGETAVRCESEGLWIRWEDIHLDSNELRIETGRDGHRTKGGRGRWVPLSEPIVSALREHMMRWRGAEYDGQTSPWVFHHAHGQRHAAAGDRVCSMRALLMAAAKRAKLPARWTPHDLRHLRITRWIEQGHPLPAIQMAAGHRDIKTTMGYVHLARGTVQQLAFAGPLAASKDARRSASHR